MLIFLLMAVPMPGAARAADMRFGAKEGRTIAILLATGIGNGLWLALQGAMAARRMLAIDGETGVSAATR